MAARLTGVLLLLAQLGSDARGPSEGAMQKVINMLQDMSAKAKQEKNAEEVAFSEFTTWCSEESTSLKTEIKTNTESIDVLTAGIAQLQTEAKDLGEAISGLNADITSYEADKESETKQREKDHTAFLAESQDYAESVDALDRALTVMEKESYDRPAAAAALLQLSDNSRVPDKAKSVLSAFISMMGDGLSYDAPEANAYEFQSGGIVGLLKKLKDQFREKLGECQKQEANSLHAYNMVVQDLTDSIAAAEKDVQEKTQQKASKEEKAAKDSKQLSATELDLAANQKTLSEVTTECSEKKFSFEEKQQLRGEEIEAIAKAVEILSSPEAAGNTEKYFSLAQIRSGVALVELRGTGAAASTAAVEGIRRKIRQFLEAEGKRLHSDQLALLAEKIAADPFAKVKKMIDSMITRLLNEANSDADHEGFCDTELGKSKITRNKLSEEIDGLAAAVEEGKATILHLTNEVAELSKASSNLRAAMGEASKMRASEKATNTETVEESKQAQAALQAAIAVLKEFYSRAMKTTAFVQTSSVTTPSGASGALLSMSAAVSAGARGVPMGSDEWNSLANPDYEGTGGYTTGIASSTVDKGHKEGMQTFGAAYKGQQDQAGGVLALLEVILSDFATLEADTNAAEVSGAKTYEAFMTQSKKDLAVKEKQIEMDNADKASAEARLADDTRDWKSTQDELLAADRYHARLVPQCIDQGQTFEERTAARAAEIASLKEALKILSSEDITTSAL